MMKHPPMTATQRLYQQAVCALLEETFPDIDPRDVELACTRDEYQRHHHDTVLCVRLQVRANGMLFAAELDEHLVRVYNPRLLMRHQDSLAVDLADPDMPELVWEYVLKRCDRFMEDTADWLARLKSERDGV